MTNLKVVKGWVEAMDKNHGYSPKRLAAPSLKADGVYLVSYATPIAKYENGKFYVTSRKYSTTTSKHQSLAKSVIPSKMLVITDDIKELD